MDTIIGFVKFDSQYHLYDADYLYWVLDLKSRLGTDSRIDIRNEIDIVDETNVNTFLSFMEQFRISIQELREDYFSLTIEEKQESLIDFLPTIFIDFDSKTYFCSHPDAEILNFEYIPKGWKYFIIDDITSLIPREYAYWKDF